MRELLDPGEPVLARVEARLEQAERERGERKHLAANSDRLVLEVRERNDRVDEAHVECLLGVVLAAEEPDLLRPLLADLRGEDARAVAAVEGADPRPALPEACVVGGDRQVADDVQDVPAADRVAGNHRNDRLRRTPDLNVQVGDVEASGRATRRVLHVAALAAHLLVAAGAERIGPLAREDDHADLEVLARLRERFRKLDHGLRAERVAHLWPADRDLCDPRRTFRRPLVADVRVIPRGLPGDRHRRSQG